MIGPWEPSVLCYVLYHTEIQKYILTFISINEDVSENSFYSSKWSHAFIFASVLLSCNFSVLNPFSIQGSHLPLIFSQYLENPPLPIDDSVL